MLHGERFPYLLVRMRKIAPKRVVQHWNGLPREEVESLCVDVHLGTGFSGEIGHCWVYSWI